MPCRLYLETAKRDSQAQAEEAAQLREGVAVRDAQCMDAANALEVAQAKVGGAMAVSIMCGAVPAHHAVGT